MEEATHEMMRRVGDDLVNSARKEVDCVIVLLIKDDVRHMTCNTHAIRAIKELTAAASNASNQLLKKMEETSDD